MISEGRLTLSPDKEKEVLFEDLTLFIGEKLKAGGLTKEQVKEIKTNLKVISKHLNVRPSTPKDIKFRMNPNEFELAMGFLNLKDAIASKRVNRQWRRDIGQDMQFWNEKLKEITYGPEAWLDLGYPIGKVPPPPDNIDGIPLLTYMKAPDPYFSDRRPRMASQRLFYVPAGIYVKKYQEENLAYIQTNISTDFDKNNLDKLIRHRTKDKPDISIGFYEYSVRPEVLREHGDTKVEKGYWALMTVDVIDGSQNKSREEQLPLVRAQPGYDRAEFIPISILTSMERIRKGEFIFTKNDRPIYSGLKETVNLRDGMYQVFFGNVAPNGPYVSFGNTHSVDMGAAALRKFL